MRVCILVCLPKLSWLLSQPKPTKEGGGTRRKGEPQQDNEGQLMDTRRSCLHQSGGVPADNIQHHYEIVIFEVRHVCPQDVGLHFQLDILWREMTATL